MKKQTGNFSYNQRIVVQFLDLSLKNGSDGWVTMSALAKETSLPSVEIIFALRYLIEAGKLESRVGDCSGNNRYRILSDQNLIKSARMTPSETEKEDSPGKKYINRQGRFPRTYSPTVNPLRKIEKLDSGVVRIELQRRPGNKTLILSREDVLAIIDANK